MIRREIVLPAAARRGLGGADRPGAARRLVRERRRARPAPGRRRELPLVERRGAPARRVTEVEPERRLAFEWDDDGRGRVHARRRRRRHAPDRRRDVAGVDDGARPAGLARSRLSDPLNLVFGALADPSRRQVIGYLVRPGHRDGDRADRRAADDAAGGDEAPRDAGRSGARRVGAPGARDALPADARRRGVGRPARRAADATCNVGAARLAAVSTYDAVKDLPLEVDGYELEPLEQQVAAGFTLRRTVVVLRGGGEEGRGEEVDYDPDAQLALPGRRGELPLRRPAHPRLVLAPAVRARPSTAAGPSSRQRSTSRCGRPGCRSAEALGRRGAAAALRRLDARAAGRAMARALPRAALQARPRRASGRTSLVEPLAGAGCVDTLDFKGVYRAEFGSPPDPELYERDRRGVPAARGSRIPALTPGDARRARRRIATGSPGTRRSTSGATSKRCRSGRAA